MALNWDFCSVSINAEFFSFRLKDSVSAVTTVSVLFLSLHNTALSIFEFVSVLISFVYWLRVETHKERAR